MSDWTQEVERLVERGRDREAAAVAVRHLPVRDQGESMEPLEQLDQLAPLLDAAVSKLEPEHLDAPTPCSEFTVRGVLEHMIDGATAFSALFRGESAAAADDGSVRGSNTLERFEQAMTALVAAMRSPGALERTIAAPFGNVPGDGFARFVILDGLVHAWDIGVATGQSNEPPARLVDEVHAFARSAITPGMREAGMFAEPTAPPSDANPMEQLAAFTGRRVERSFP